ncbi:MAG TPA: hypothetical protein PKH77_20710, partial [Anaerolineae bacterium]|nr:hypothetical protein [Anaerolineae bacterium]
LLPPAFTAAALYLPWVLAAARSLGVNRGYWPGHLPFTAFLRTTFQGITVFSFITPEQVALTIAGGILVLAMLALAFTRRRPLAGLYSLCYLLPVALLGYIYRSVPKWGLRHSVLFAPAPFLALAVAWGCAQCRSARVTLGVAAALVALPLLWADANLLTNPAFAHEDWRGAAQYVQTHRQPDDVVIVETGSTFPTWVYYAGDKNLLPFPDETLLDVTNVLHYGNVAPLLNARLQTAGRVWLVGWLANVTDPTDIVATLLDDIGDETPLPVFHGLTLRRFDLARAPDFPPEPPAAVRMDVALLPGTGRGDPAPTDGVRLWGYTLPEMLAADAPLTLRTWWTVADPAAHCDRFYQMSLRLTDAAGHDWARSDAPPGAGDYRPERWPADTPVMGTVTLNLPPGAPAGTYTATLILYYAEQTAAPLTLGTVRVTRPTTPPDIPPGMTPVAAIPNAAPVALLALRLDDDTLTPCADVTGELFWEVRQPLTGSARVHVALGETAHTQPLTADFDPAGWRTGDRFLGRFHLPLPCRAPDVTAPLAITLLPAANDIPLVTWIGPEVTAGFGRQFALPEEATPLADAVQTEIAALAGYRLEPTPVSAGQPFTLTLYWRVTTETDAPYTAFVHATPPEAPGNVAAQHDSWPAQGARATYTWLTGEIVADAHPLPALPSGGYALRVGLYGLDAVRLPLVVNGRPAPDAVYVIPNSLEVQP